MYKACLAAWCLTSYVCAAAITQRIHWVEKLRVTKTANFIIITYCNPTTIAVYYYQGHLKNVFDTYAIASNICNAHVFF